MRTASTARAIGKRMRLPFWRELIAESIWRAMGWVSDGLENTALTTLEHVYAWRSTTRWKHTSSEDEGGTLQPHKVETYVACAIGGMCGTRSPLDGQVQKSGVEKEEDPPVKGTNGIS